MVISCLIVDIWIYCVAQCKKDVASQQGSEREKEDLDLKRLVGEWPREHNCTYHDLKERQTQAYYLGALTALQTE